LHVRDSASAVESDDEASGDAAVHRRRHALNDQSELRHVAIHGHEIAYRTAGDGPVVVLVHGMAGCSHTWRYVVPALARRFTVVAPDLLGHGASAKPRAEYSNGAHANVVRDLMIALGHDRATFVGQSYGGGVVMQLAYQFPERCERLVLVSSGGLGPEVSGLLRSLTLPGAEHVLALACSAALLRGGDRFGSWLQRAGLRPGPVLEEVRRCWHSLAEPATRRAFFKTLRAVVDHRGQTVSAADRLYLTAAVPTLIVWGADDSLIPADHARAAHAAMPNSRMEVFEGVGHFPHCEAPERFVETILSFIVASEPARWSEANLRETFRAAAAGGR
jgi:pimeloyl-ACP methyl ester carboxylesterase